MKIALTSVCVSDPLKAFKFYTEVLGFAEKMYMPETEVLYSKKNLQKRIGEWKLFLMTPVAISYR